MNMLLIVPLAFGCEFIDSSLGMGYGTSLTPLLLLLGYDPIQIVPTILLSEFVTGLLAAFGHHRSENVNFRRNSKDTKVAVLLSAFAVVGAIVSVCIAVSLPKDVLSLVIAIIIISMGVYLLFSLTQKPRFSWTKIAALGFIASVNKGLSGGGYGPLVTGGQILAGNGVKNSVGITSFSESVTCLVGVLAYFILSQEADWSLAPWMLLGAVLSVPFSVRAVKHISDTSAKKLIAIAIIILGGLTLYKVVV